MNVALALAALATQVPTSFAFRPAVPIRDWLLGTLPGRMGTVGPPRIDAAWRTVTAGPDNLLSTELPHKSPDAQPLYAATYARSPEDASGLLVITRGDGITLWLNGQRLSPPERDRRAAPNRDTIDIRLAAGWNSLIVQLPRPGEFGAWLVFEEALELAPRPPPDASRDNVPAPAFTVSPLTVEQPLSWRGAALEATATVRVTPWGRTAPDAVLLHLVVARDTLTVDPLKLGAPAEPITVRRVRDFGSLSRVALAPAHARHVLVTPGHVSLHPVDLDPAALLRLLDGPIRLANWHLSDGVLEGSVAIPPVFTGLSLDLLVSDLGPRAAYTVNGTAVAWHQGKLRLCGPCGLGETLVIRIEGDPNWPTTGLPVARVRDRTYTDLSRNWLLTGAPGTAPDPAAWLAAMLDAGKTAYRDLVRQDSARVEAAGAWLRGDTIYLLGHAPPGDRPERVWRAGLAAQQRFPRAKFAAGEAWAYRHVGTVAPTLLDSIRRAVRSGAWSLVGGLWAAGDPDVASGEALVRQGLYGQTEFQRLFERRCATAWATDGTALPWTLPQIWRGLGMDRLVVAAALESAPNGPFLWEGPDGSQLLTAPAGEYSLEGPGLIGALSSAPRHGVVALYGTADTIPEGFDTALGRSEDLRRLPVFGALVDAGPERALDAVSRRAGTLPVWRRGLPPATLDRTRAPGDERSRIEALLLSSELLATIDTAPYPSGELDRAWRSVLRRRVPVDEHALSAVRTAQSSAFDRLARRLDTRGGGVAVVVFNPSSWVRSGHVAVPLDDDLRRGRRLLRLSRIVDAARRTGPVVFREDSMHFFAREVPPLGAKVFWVQRGPAPDGTLDAGPARLENEFLVVDIDTIRGGLHRAYDKTTGQQLIAPGPEDNWVGWDDPPAGPTFAAPSVRHGGGALERWIEVERAWGGGRLVQRFILRRDDPLLTVEGSVEGGAAGLTASFGLTVAADSAWFELPYGAAPLPTMARGAPAYTPRLRWTDLSARGFGVSLFSARPTRWTVRGGAVRLALSAGAEPQPQTFRYALYTHGGDWRSGETTRRAEEFTAPLLAKRVSSHGGPAGHAWSLLTLDAAHVYVGAVKRADVGRAIVVRLVETQGRAGQVTLTFARRMARVRTANLLEDPLSIVPLTSDHVVTLSLAPWEIVTILIDETP